MYLELLSYEKDHLPKGWKPYYIYNIIENHHEIGRIVLREGTCQERYFDGHIGYTIEEEYRGHHYSREACLLLFDKAKEIGLTQLIITCSPENIASRRIIESLPSEFIEEKEIPTSLRKDFDDNERVKRIYQITL